MDSTILLVDDEQNVLSSLKRVLEEDGYKILTAKSGLEGLKLLENNPSIQIIISDQRMPNMTGAEFLAQVKKLYPQTIRIILSGYSDFDAVKDAINEGSIYKYLNKPWDNDLMLSMVKDAFLAYANKNKSKETIKKEAEAEVKRLQNEFLANMSHEIRTPLNGIIGFAEILCNGVIDVKSPEHKECLQDILTSSKTLSQLLINVLDLTQIQADQLEFSPELIDLDKLINEVKETFKKEISDKKLNLKIKLDPKIKDISIDPEKLKKVISHYISNAIKFSHEAGEIEISAHLEGENQFRINVKDHGVGIKPTDIPNLFKPFKQLDMSSAKKAQGAGICLAVTRLLVEAQNGKVGVDSTFGKGSTFYAVFPTKSNA